MAGESDINFRSGIAYRLTPSTTVELLNSPGLGLHSLGVYVGTSNGNATNYY